MSEPKERDVKIAMAVLGGGIGTILGFMIYKAVKETSQQIKENKIKLNPFEVAKSYSFPSTSKTVTSSQGSSAGTETSKKTHPIQKGATCPSGYSMSSRGNCYKLVEKTQKVYKYSKYSIDVYYYVDFFKYEYFDASFPNNKKYFTEYIIQKVVVNGKPPELVGMVEELASELASSVNSQEKGELEIVLGLAGEPGSALSTTVEQSLSWIDSYIDKVVAPVVLVNPSLDTLKQQACNKLPILLVEHLSSSYTLNMMTPTGTAVCNIPSYQFPTAYNWCEKEPNVVVIVTTRQAFYDFYLFTSYALRHNCW